MNAFLFFLSAMILASSSAEARLLARFCAQANGEMIAQWTCPESGVKREGPFCRMLGDDGSTRVVNGCTGSSGEFTDILFEACVLHDLCYHHEPVSTGKSKAQCDQKLRRDGAALCAKINDPDRRQSCDGTVTAFYLAVRLFGDDSWACQKDVSEYPKTLRSIKFRRSAR